MTGLFHSGLAQKSLTRDCKHTCNFLRTLNFHLRRQYSGDLFRRSIVCLHDLPQELFSVEQRDLELTIKLSCLEELHESSEQTGADFSTTTETLKRYRFAVQGDGRYQNEKEGRLDGDRQLSSGRALR